jgi:hypothetical protein
MPPANDHVEVGCARHGGRTLRGSRCSPSVVDRDLRCAAGLIAASFEASVSQPPVDNQTDYVVFPQVLCDRDGEKLAVIVKATFELAIDGKIRGKDGTFEIAPKDRRRGVRAADIPWGKPTIPSILFPADLCLRKPGTDIIVTGVGVAPRGEPAPFFDSGVRVGKLSKTVRVFGPRTWLPNGSGLTRPEPIDALPIRWDNAWGGLDDSDPARIVEEPANPVGRGKVRDLGSLGGKPAHQIEDPALPIDVASRDWVPAGLSAIARSFTPRRHLFGTYDKAWLDDQAPLLPKDFDDRANLCASPGLNSPVPLRGGEDGALMNLTPGGGTVTFVLPRIPLELVFIVEGRAPESVFPSIDTLLIDTLPNEADTRMTIELVMRASIAAPRKLKTAMIVAKERKS